MGAFSLIVVINLLNRSNELSRNLKMSETEKILCLHAYGQNNRVFRQATGSFRKLFKKFNFEFIFADAPHQITDPSFEKGQLAWYFVNKEDRHLDPEGLNESSEALNKLLDEHKPVGIIGFSQGASIFSLHCAEGA